MLKVGVIGATGYAGLECVRLLALHPQVSLTALSSVSYEGKVISEIFPALSGICDLPLQTQEEVIARCELVFCALPAGLSEEVAAACAKVNKRVIDLGSDFRIRDEETYETWYQLTYKEKKLHEKAVYSMPELHGAPPQYATVVANPGCYPTAVCLGAAPVLKAGLCRPDFIADVKSGLTGAGRKPTQTSHFVEVNEGFCAYKAGVHRHTPEIEQCLSEFAETQVRLTFVPHLLPVNRGILATLYLNLERETTYAEIEELYRDFYQDKPFVRLRAAGEYVNLHEVTHSNYCDISLHPDLRCSRLVVCSVIDNMVKGAAGGAVQNMNLWYGFGETSGLAAVPAIL